MCAACTKVSKTCLCLHMCACVVMMLPQSVAFVAFFWCVGQHCDVGKEVAEEFLVVDNDFEELGLLGCVIATLERCANLKETVGRLKMLRGIGCQQYCACQNK